MDRVFLRLICSGPRGNWFKSPRVHAYLRAYGIELTRQEAPAELIVTQQPGLLQLPSSKPTILVELSDQECLRPATRAFIRMPFVKAVLRPYVLRDASQQNSRTFFGSTVHTKTWQFFGDGGQPREEWVNPSSLAPAEIAKIKLSLPMIATRYKAIEDGFHYANQPSWESRAFDVGFIGRVHYSSAAQRGRGVIMPAEMHRKAMLARLNTVAGITRDVQAIGPDDHPWIGHLHWRKRLWNCRIALAPWGHSAWSYRDVESILCGCAVIKPRCHEVMTIPDLYAEDSPWVYWCEPDFSDLNDVIQAILANPPTELHSRALAFADANHPADSIPLLSQHIREALAG